jgi:lipopolysaccharide export LptBFGC system permease protein LptF
MRHVPIGLFVLAGSCGLFAYWGMFTAGGSHVFDEMDGMIPFLVGLAAIPLLLGAGICWWFVRPSKRAQSTSDAQP